MFFYFVEKLRDHKTIQTVSALCIQSRLPACSTAVVRAAWEMEVQVRQALVLECGGLVHLLTTEDVHGIPMIKVHPQQRWLRPLAGERGVDLPGPQLSAVIGMVVQSIRKRIHEVRVRSGQAGAAKAEDIKANFNEARTFVGLGDSDSETEEDKEKEPPAKKQRRRVGQRNAPSKAHTSDLVVPCACFSSCRTDDTKQ